MTLDQEWEFRFRLYARKGGKRSRRQTVDRIRRFLTESQARPEQIGKRHVYEFFERHADFSVTTQRDYYYAIRLLWRLLGRDSRPPKPKALERATRPLSEASPG